MVYNKKYATAPENFEQIEAFLNSYQVTDENKDVNMIVGWDTQDCGQITHLAEAMWITAARRARS